MSFAEPRALLLLVPAITLVAWLTLRQGQAVMSLPGHWRRIIDTTMQPFMAQRVVSQIRLPVVLWSATWALLVLCLARPILDIGEPTEYGNLAGRVIALDIGAGRDIERQRLIAFRILDAAPSVPTALVVATAEAFDIVPFTTDRAHLDRYLRVIDPELMPVAGRAPGIAITHAEALLKRADMAVGQLVLVTGGGAPTIAATGAGKWLRALVVDPNGADGWQAYADRIGARVADDTSIDAVIDDLDDEVAKALRDSDDAAAYDLRPWLVSAAALLWLFFFRRIGST